MPRRCATSGDGVYTRSETTNRGAVPQNSLLRLAPGDDAEVVFNARQVRYSAVSWQPLVQPFPAELSVDRHLTDVKHSAGFRWRYATIELDEHTDLSALPDGIYARWRFTLIISAMSR